MGVLWRCSGVGCRCRGGRGDGMGASVRSGVLGGCGGVGVRGWCVCGGGGSRGPGGEAEGGPCSLY